MSFAGIVFSVLAYLVTIIFVFGLLHKIVQYARTPSPLRIPLTPAPETRTGVLFRLLGEGFLFKQLFKTNFVLWLGAWLFHVSFLLVVLRHLRYFLYPVPEWVMALQTIGIYAGYVLPFTLLYLLGRKFFMERNVYISNPVDYYMLFLLIGIAGTGIWMKYFGRVFLIDVKAYILALYTFSFDAPSVHPLFVVHLLLVFVLVAYFPFSKLLHAPGVFFSPSFAQPNDIQRKRYVNPWDYDVPGEPFYTWKDKIGAHKD